LYLSIPPIRNAYVHFAYVHCVAGPSSRVIAFARQIREATMRMGRRSVLQALAAAAAMPSAGQSAPAKPSKSSSRDRILIKGGYVVTLDDGIGELPVGDVLIDGPTIAAIGKDLRAGDAEIIDAREKLVLPGLIDTHRHTWETVTRSLISEGDLAVYIKLFFQTLGPHYRVEDVYVGNLLGALGALSTGITTLLDWSHIINTPAHADAAIRGLADSGIRGVFAYGNSAVPGSDTPEANARRVADIKRVQKQYFASDDQLLTMAIAPRDAAADIRLARELGLRVTIHVIKAGAVAELNAAGLLGPDITYVHTVGLESTDEEYRMIADHGGTISTSSATEMMSGHGFPSAQRWLRYGLRPSFSVDNETRMPSDLFAQMRALIIADHQLESDRVRREGGRPKLIPIRDVLGFATIEGARATGLERKTGSLSLGKRADVILADLDDITLIPNTDPVASFVLRAQPANVSWVLVDGKVKKRAGKLVGVDYPKLRRLVAESHAHIMGLVNAAGFDIRKG
jgi:5-methylthioadenosine/S-adenosylhomocysteine deaminase